MSRRPIFLSFLLSAVVGVVAFLAASGPALANDLYTPGSYGYDISYVTQSPYPSGPYSFGIVGVTGGRAFSYNASLDSEYKSVAATVGSAQVSLYMNLNYPVGSTASNGNTGPKGKCSASDKACIAYNYGYNAAQDAYIYATNQGASASVWWLDIETANSWSPKTSLNDLVIQGAIDYLSSKSITVGIYSTASMWKSIAGTGYNPGLANWVPGASSQSALPDYCSKAVPFGGGSVTLVQYGGGSYDVDYACP